VHGEASETRDVKDVGICVGNAELATQENNIRDIHTHKLPTLTIDKCPKLTGACATASHIEKIDDILHCRSRSLVQFNVIGTFVINSVNTHEHLLNLYASDGL
jgi:hypothetical protein